jgi:adenylate kinase
MEKIILTGTPGTGKTSVSIELGRRLHCEVLSINQIVLQKKFFSSFDEKREAYIVKPEKLIKYMEDKVDSFKKSNQKFLVIEGHYSDIIPPELIDMIFILRCHPRILKKRLKVKNVKDKSIRENIQAEILGNSANFILEKIKEFGNIPIMEINTTKYSILEIVGLIIKLIKHKELREKYIVGKIDWLGDLYRNDKIFDFF